MTDRLDFYFDFISPYSYFAWFRVAELADRRGLELALHPILFAGVLNHWGQLGPAEIPPKRAWTFRDCFRYAALHRLPFQGPAAHPFKPLLVLRAALPEVAGPDQRQVIDALYRAIWGTGIDPEQPGAVVGALEAAGLDGVALVSRAGEPAAKDGLRRETEAAIGRGVFGVPTLILGDELFWGNDRLEYVELHLDGRDPLDRDALRRFAERPLGTARPRPG